MVGAPSSAPKDACINFLGEVEILLACVRCYGNVWGLGAPQIGSLGDRDQLGEGAF